jgi:hypothetical protein
MGALIDDLTAMRSSIHMHTFASDGAASLQEIVAAARQEGLDCIVVSDHNTLGHNINGYAGDVLVLTGIEVTPHYREKITDTGEIKGASANSHILALGLETMIANEGRWDSQELIDLINAGGGMAFIAHPEEPGHNWADWKVDGFTGMELWTFKAAWKLGSAAAPSKTYAWRNPDSVLSGPSEQVLHTWDSLGRGRRVVGIGCADNHGYMTAIDGTSRSIFPWNVGLAGIVSHVLVEKEALAQDPRAAFLSAVRSGHVIVAHDGLAPAAGFETRAVNLKTGESFAPGDCIQTTDDLCIEVSSPRPAALCILRDGQVLHEEEGQHIQVKIEEAGVWRVEAQLAGRPWVFANPFYIRVWG